MEAIGKLVQSRLLQHHHHRNHQKLKDDLEVDCDEEELGRLKSEVTNDSIERDEKPMKEGASSNSSSRPTLGGTFSIDSLLRSVSKSYCIRTHFYTMLPW